MANSTDTPQRRALSKEGGQRDGFRWVHIHDLDELESFYRSILPALKIAAMSYGYALGVHGSLRRDLDLIAAPWNDDYADKDGLARGLQEAACGLWQEKYQWQQKPCGRVAVSIAVCWTDHTDAFPNHTSLGCIDLSVVPAVQSETCTTKDDRLVRAARRARMHIANGGAFRTNDSMLDELAEALKPYDN